jgi:repressor LexA
MTKTDSDTLIALLEYLDRYGYPPSLRDLGESCGVTGAAIRGRLLSLERKGYIQVAANVSRGIRVLEKGRRAFL